MADYDKAISPGAVGKIILNLNPKNCAGGKRKVTTVLTNDPKGSRFTLVLQGNLKEE